MGGWRTERHEDVNVQTHQLRGEGGESLYLVLRVAALDGDGVSLVPTQLTELCQEG